MLRATFLRNEYSKIQKKEVSFPIVFLKWQHNMVTSHLIPSQLQAFPPQEGQPHGCASRAVAHDSVPRRNPVLILMFCCCCLDMLSNFTFELVFYKWSLMGQGVHSWTEGLLLGCVLRGTDQQVPGAADSSVYMEHHRAHTHKPGVVQDVEGTPRRQLGLDLGLAWWWQQEHWWPWERGGYGRGQYWDRGCDPGFVVHLGSWAPELLHKH